ncbi:MAG: hypothetical protein FWH00_00400 [Oscillospiraceae bacterium]|nr:hypothetical protein [Oscillospiraceae bacterium]
MRLLYSNRAGIQKPGAYIAQVSYSEGGDFGALWDSERRDISLFAPRGMRYRPCEGDSLLMLPGEGQDVCAGVLSKSGGLLPGELEICWPNGSRIKLCENGDILLNSVVITKDGELIRKEGI